MVDGAAPSSAADAHPTRSEASGNGAEPADVGTSIGAGWGDDERAGPIKSFADFACVLSGREGDAALAIDAVQVFDGSMAEDGADVRIDSNFGFDVPIALNDVEGKLLDPRESWVDKMAYDQAAKELAAKFAKAKMSRIN